MASGADDVHEDFEIPEARYERAFHLEHFCGRETLLASIDEWIDAPDRGSFLLLSGGPGSGKSALAAALAERRDAPCHFMKSHRSPARFLPALTTQAADRAGIRLGDRAYVGDPDDLRNALLQAVEVLARVRGRAVVVLDALDEADVSALAALPAHVPEGARFVLTARPDAALLSALRSRIGHFERVEIPPLTTSDVAAILARVGNAFDAATVTERTGGLPLLVRRAADTALDAIPATVTELFEGVYRAIAEGKPERERLLALLSVAREALDARDLAALTAVQGEAIGMKACRDHLTAMSAFLLEAAPAAFVPWHRGLADHVQTEVLGPDGVRGLEATFASWAAPIDERGTFTSYGLRHRVAHLVAAGRRDEAAAQLSSTAFLEAKIAAGQIFDLVAELASAGSNLTEPIRRHAHFLARYPRALPTILPEAAPTDRAWLKRLRPTELEADVSEVFRLRSADAEVLAIAMSPDEATVAAVSVDGTLRAWDVATGRCTMEVSVSKRRALAVAYSPDGSTIACGAEGEGLVLLSTSGSELARAARGEAIWSVAYAPDGRTIAAGTRKGELVLLGPGGDERSRWQAGGSLTSIVFSPDGQRIVVGAAQGKVLVLDRAGEALTKITLDETTPWSVALIEHPSSILAACGDGTLRAFDERGAPRWEQPVADDRLYAAAVSPDGTSIALGGARGKLHVLAGEDLRLSGRHHAAINSVAFSRSGGVIVAGCADGTVLGYRAGATTTEDTRAPITATAFSPDGSVLAAGRFDGELRAWRMTSTPPGQLFVLDRSHKSRITALAFGDQGLIASGTQEGIARVFRVEQLRDNGERKRPLATLVGHDAAVTAALFLPVAGRVATGSSDHTVRLWSVFGGRQTARFDHDDTIVAVACPSSGDRIAAVARNGCVKVWEIASGRLVAGIDDATDEAGARALSFSRDDSCILVERRDRTWAGWAIDAGTTATSAPRALSAVALSKYVPRYVFRNDALRREMVLVDAATMAIVGAYPSPVEAACVSPGGDRIAGWTAGELTLLAVIEPTSD